MTKTEFYNKVAGLTKKTGQGIELKLALMIPGFNKIMLDELIDDGLLKLIHQSYSYLPSSDWICLTNIYNVEEDPNNMFFMRYYLGFPDDFVEKHLKIDNKTREDIIAEKIKEYKDFVNKNIEGLEAIKRIKTNINITDSLDSDTINFLVERKWYTDNLSLLEAIKDCEEAKDNEVQQLKLQKRLNELYEQEGIYEIKKKENYHDMIENENNIKYRDKILYLMKNSEDKTIKIQEFFKNYIYEKI